MKVFSIISVMLMGIACYAHQPDLSTTVLSTTKNGVHVLQITSALTAFEGEINYLYSKEAYKTPDEFKDLVIKHFSKNVSFVVNGTDTLKFANPQVILGHETRFITEVVNIPDNIKALYYNNTMFKDMHQNKMHVVMLTEGFPKSQFYLANKNNHTIQLELKKGQWESIEYNSNTSNLSSWVIVKNITYILIILSLILTPIYFWNRTKTRIAN